MKDIKRKVGFFFLTLGRNDDNLSISESVNNVLTYINGLSKSARKIEFKDDRFCFIESISGNDTNDYFKVLFKSANHSYRSPLINRRTVEERENPKTLEEGERYKTHLILKIDDDGAYVFLESYKGALKMKYITDYLNNYILHYNNTHKRNKFNFHFGYDIIPKEDFREILESMGRVVCASVLIEKQQLGSASLNLSERTEEVQEDIILEIKAKRNQSIKDTVKDLFAKYLIGKQVVKKIRVRGKSAQNSDIIIDTDFIGKREYVPAHLNEDTGEINTSFMFTQLESLSKEFFN